MPQETPNVNLMFGFADVVNPTQIKGNAKLLKMYKERLFYSCNQDFDSVKYVDSGSKEKINFVAYSGNDEKSLGVFNKDGLISAERKSELRASLRKTKSVVWHGVISFEQEFGNKYCSCFERAQTLMKNALPKFLKDANLNPDNIDWYAGLHENTDNKHIHFSFYEKTPQKTRQRSKKYFFSQGAVPLKALNNFKLSIELSLLNSKYEIYENRKSLLTEFKEQTANKGVNMTTFIRLFNEVPKSHRISYDSENMEKYRKQIDLVTQSIINSNKSLNAKFKFFIETLMKRDEDIRLAYEKLKIDYSNKLLCEKYLNDIYRRLGNIVLQTIKDIRIKQAKLEIATNKRLVQKRIEKNKRKILIKKCLQLNEIVNNEIINSFKEYINKLEEANYKRLKEEGYLD